MRNNLYMFRHNKRLSQAEMAEKIGCHRATYAAIEIGTRDGRLAFWAKLQKAFDIPNADLVALMKKDNTDRAND